MKKTSVIRVLVCVLLTAVTVFSFTACSEKQPDEKPVEDRVYGSINTGVMLNADLTFVANLYHGVVKTGTYSESTGSDGVTTVTYTVDGYEVFGTIKNDVLTIPPEWSDSHGHGSTFALQ
ncbi:MAG: hypothetical protein FWF05_00740 [Oscillospiraceae bacterium]|nr:hypothetical protein [Oscillospiraceae bacterium]